MNKELQDHVWKHCLPKEFKEKVKYEYRRVATKATKDEYDLGFMHAQEGMFGIHNLTSDAEGEEMLMVPRSAVIAEMDKLHKYSFQMPDLQLGLNALTALFGSKCLPDAPSSAPSIKLNALSSVGNEDDFTSKEPTDLDEESSTCTNDCPSQCPSLGKETSKMKPIESKVSVYIATKEEDEEFRLLLHKNGFKWKSGMSLISDSCWASGSEENKIHYVYPHKIVAYYGDKTSETLTFTEFKKRYFSEDVNLSQETANCDKQFDDILKDSFREHSRLHIAVMMMQGLLANSNNSANLSETVADALKCADALIIEVEKQTTPKNKQI